MHQVLSGRRDRIGRYCYRALLIFSPSSPYRAPSGNATRRRWPNLTRIAYQQGAMTEAEFDFERASRPPGSRAVHGRRGRDRGAVQRALDLTPAQLRRLLELGRTTAIPGS